MSASIIIRTYHKDIPWLQLSLESIDKYVSGFTEVIVLFPKEDFDKGDWSCLSRDTIGGMPFFAHGITPEVADGYIDQQVSKIYADTWTQADHILFVDSDIVFFRPVTPVDFMREGRPFIMYTPYAKFPVDTDMPWQPITEAFLKHTVDYEFMRRLPAMYPRSILHEVREFCILTHNVSLLSYLRTVKDRAFSEFNVIGAYAYYHASRSVTFIPTDSVRITDAGPTFAANDIPTPCAMQFWSWGRGEEQMEEARRLIGNAGVTA